MIDRIAPDVVLSAYKARARSDRSAHYQAADLPRPSFAGKPVERRIFGDHIKGGEVPFPPTLKLTLLYRKDRLVIARKHFR